METFNLHISGELKPFARGLDIPQPLSELVSKMLNKEPDDRPSSMKEVKSSLLSILESMNVKAG